MPCRWFTSLMLLGCVLLAGAQRVGAAMLSPEKIASGVRGVIVADCTGENADGAPETQRVAEAVATEVVLGRSEWLSKDPLGEDGGINLYGFCGNNAVNNIDALGRVSVDLKFGAFIPNTKGFWVLNSPVPGVQWYPEPDPFFSTYWFSTDNRAKAGDSGTSRVYTKTRAQISASDIGHLKSKENSLFEVHSDASNRIHIVYAWPTTDPKYAGDWQTQTASPSLKTTVTDDPGGCSSKITVTGSGSYPFGALGFLPAPAIDFKVTWTLKRSGSGSGNDPVDVSIEGTHDQFPAYEAVVNGHSVLYEYYPSDPGPTLSNLTTSMDFDKRGITIVR